jgi:glutamyl-tRNA reductase
MENALFILGVNHRTAPVAVRERLAYAETEVAPALQRLKQATGIAEAALLSTCNRVEVIGVTSDPDRAEAQVSAFLAADRAVERAAFTDALYHFNGRDAVRHLFRVGASLDSMVVGEPQILGQLKLAYAQAAEAATVGLILHRAFHKAFQVAKRVRKATLIGHGSVSISSVAVSLAGQIFDTLGDKTAMLMGAGKMAELTARHLKALGIESLLITSRTFDRAVALARELGGTAVPFENYKPYLRIADILIGSLSVTKPMLAHHDVEAIIRERKYRPMFMIDLGVPRNFDERLNEIENVYLYDIDDLDAVAQKSLGHREREAEKAEEIVVEEIEAFLKWLAELEIVPTIKDIRVSMERLRDLELTRHRAWLATLEPAERERIEMLTRGLVNKLLHRVMAGLRHHDRSSPEAINTAEVARRLLLESNGTTPDASDLDDFDDDLLEDDPTKGSSDDDADPL